MVINFDGLHDEWFAKLRHPDNLFKFEFAFNENPLAGLRNWNFVDNFDVKLPVFAFGEC
jgi:hypothetical protein